MSESVSHSEYPSERVSSRVVPSGNLTKALRHWGKKNTADDSGFSRQTRERIAWIIYAKDVWNAYNSYIYITHYKS